MTKKMTQEEFLTKLMTLPWYKDISQGADKIEYDYNLNRISLFFTDSTKATDCISKGDHRNILIYGPYSTWEIIDENSTLYYRVSLPVYGYKQRCPEPLQNWPDLHFYLD